MNNYILLTLIGFVIIITIYILSNYVHREKYKQLRHLGFFPIINSRKIAIVNRERRHKYSGHRYRHRRRYNFLGRRASE